MVILELREMCLEVILRPLFYTHLYDYYLLLRQDFQEEVHTYNIEVSRITSQDELLISDSIGD